MVAYIKWSLTGGVVAFESSDHIGAYVNCRDLPMFQMVNIHMQIKFHKKYGTCTSHWENSVSCAIQECDYNAMLHVVHTLLSNFCSIICQVTTYGRLKKKKISNFWTVHADLMKLKVAAYKRFQKIVIWLGQFWYFGKMVAKDRWSLSRVNHLWELVATRGLTALIHVGSIY